MEKLEGLRALFHPQDPVAKMAADLRDRQQREFARYAMDQAKRDENAAQAQMSVGHDEKQAQTGSYHSVADTLDEFRRSFGAVQ